MLSQKTLSKSRSIFLLILFTCSIFSFTNAAAISWTGAIDTDWFTAGNWSTSSVPTAADEVTIQGIHTISITGGTQAAPGSLVVIDATVTIASGSTLNIGSLSVATTGYSAHFNNATIVNNGNFWTSGGLWMEVNSSFTNNASVVDFSGQTNSDINFFLDTGSTFTNSVGGVMHGRQNVDNAGNRHSAMLQMDNGSTFLNSGHFYNQYTSGIQDYLINGIILKNGSVFKNLAGFINLNWIQQRAIILENDPLSSNVTTFENSTSLRMRESDAATDNTSIAIEGEVNTSFKNLGGAQFAMWYAGGFAPGFDNTTPQVDMQGTIVYFSTTVAFDPGALALAGSAILAGNGPLNNADISYLGGGISPGSSPGIITFEESFAPASPVSLQMELAGTSGAGAVDGHDQIVFNTTPNDISNASIDVVLIDGFIPTNTDQFMLFSGAYTGTFSSINLAGGNAAWIVNYNANDITIVKNSTPLMNIGNTGIGTDAPKAKLQVTDGDVYLETLGSGVIMKDAMGNCRKLTIDGSGVITAVLVTCPQ